MRLAALAVVLSLMLGLFAASAAAQESAPPAPSAAVSASASASATPGPGASVSPKPAGPNEPARPASFKAENEKYSLSVDDTTRWAPYDGSVRFSIKGMDPANVPRVDVSFRWKLEGQKWGPPHVAQRVAVTPDGTGTFAVNVPFGWRDSPTGVAVEPLVIGIPVAEVRIRLLKAATTPGGIPEEEAHFTREIGITSKAISFALALAFLVVACVFLIVFTRAVRVPGNITLRVISQSNGWASLSQFQIVLWTLLIATGAVYVVTLTGTLLVITSGTLILLGIAGATAVGSQMKSNQAPRTDTLAPGAVSDVAIVGAPASDGALIAWSPVPGVSITYTVQCSTDGGATWVTDAFVHSTRVRLVTLAPATAHQVRVLATNAMGSGPAGMVAFTTVAAPVAPAAGAPVAVRGLRTTAPAAADRIPLAWDKEPSATGYRLEYRPHRSDHAWQPAGSVAPSSAPRGNIDGLDANTVYDVRVVAFNAQGDGLPSPLLQVTTGARLPRWSDLVIDSSEPHQIDVTRLQMLLFTAISAFFVALKIGESGSIPEIPDSYVTLMGISNGVYLTAKFVSPR
jgi:hypothetical protein